MTFFRPFCLAFAFIASVALGNDYAHPAPSELFSSHCRSLLRRVLRNRYDSNKKPDPAIAAFLEDLLREIRMSRLVDFSGVAHPSYHYLMGGVVAAQGAVFPAEKILTAQGVNFTRQHELLDTGGAQFKAPFLSFSTHGDHPLNQFARMVEEMFPGTPTRFSGFTEGQGGLAAMHETHGYTVPIARLYDEEPSHIDTHELHHRFLTKNAPFSLLNAGAHHVLNTSGDDYQQYFNFSEVLTYLVEARVLAMTYHYYLSHPQHMEATEREAFQKHVHKKLWKKLNDMGFVYEVALKNIEEVLNRKHEGKLIELLDEPATYHLEVQNPDGSSFFLKIVSKELARLLPTDKSGSAYLSNETQPLLDAFVSDQIARGFGHLKETLEPVVNELLSLRHHISTFEAPGQKDMNEVLRILRRANQRLLPLLEPFTDPR